jgi:hypothetical protein
VSSFDEAFRRQAADRQAAEARERSQADAFRARNAAGLPIVQQMLADFLRAVDGRIRPKRYIAGNRRSPKGYALSGAGGPWRGAYLMVITPDGRLWEEGGSYRPLSHGYFELNGETLSRLEVNSAPVRIGTDGKPYAMCGGDRDRPTPLPEALAVVAVRLLAE